MPDCSSLGCFLNQSLDYSSDCQIPDYPSDCYYCQSPDCPNAYCYQSLDFGHDAYYYQTLDCDGFHYQIPGYDVCDDGHGDDGRDDGRGDADGVNDVERIRDGREWRERSSESGGMRCGSCGTCLIISSKLCPCFDDKTKIK